MWNNHKHYFGQYLVFVAWDNQKLLQLYSRCGCNDYSFQTHHYGLPCSRWGCLNDLHRIKMCFIASESWTFVIKVEMQAKSQLSHCSAPLGDWRNRCQAPSALGHMKSGGINILALATSLCCAHTLNFYCCIAIEPCWWVICTVQCIWHGCWCGIIGTCFNLMWDCIKTRYICRQGASFSLFPEQTL